MGYADPRSDAAGGSPPEAPRPSIARESVGTAGPARIAPNPETALGLRVVALLSAFAGAVDACGFFLLKDLFVSFMSGNTTSLGAALAHRDLPRVLLIASMVIGFVSGAMVGTMVATLAGRRHLVVIVLFVAAVLAVPQALPAATIPAMTFAMGALNAAMDHAGPVGVSITYVTGTLVKLGRGLGLALCRRSPGLDWLRQAVPWLGILSGSAIATLALVAYGQAVIAALPGIAIGLALLIAALTRGREDAAT